VTSGISESVLDFSHRIKCGSASYEEASMLYLSSGSV